MPEKSIEVYLSPPFDHVKVTYPVYLAENSDPAVRITNTNTGTVQHWHGTYAQALGRSLTQ